MNGNQESGRHAPETRRRLSQEALLTVPHRMMVGAEAAKYMQQCILRQYPPVEQPTTPVTGGYNEYLPAGVADMVKQEVVTDSSSVADTYVDPDPDGFVSEIVDTPEAGVPTEETYGRFESPDVAAFFRDLELQEKSVDA